uniref:KHA domain-containing protein n=1 Tax=Ciona intestinalis TaxID=7719 RepID=H2XPV2_CIOIN
MKPRVQVFESRQHSTGKVFVLPSTFQELLQQVESEYHAHVNVLYTKDGASITDIDLIRDDDLLYVANNLENPVPNNSDDVTVNKMQYNHKSSEWITLNVGGKLFTTTRTTLVTRDPESMLAKMFQYPDRWSNTTDKNGAYLFDRSPEYFEPLLDFLRHGKLILNPNINPQGILEEATFYGLTSAAEEAEKLLKDQQMQIYSEPLTRSMVIKALLSSPGKCELRFQGVNFAGADLSRLDLRYVNFKLATLTNCNLSQANLYCCSLERTNLSGSILDGANLQGARMICCNAEGCSMKACNFDDPSGIKANMEGANMKGVNFEGSLLAGANLRVATLKNSNLKNCDLRGAILAGTDLEDCDLSGCDLFEANLRGCNVKGTKFEEMITPLHMTQSVP